MAEDVAITFRGLLIQRGMNGNACNELIVPRRVETARSPLGPLKCRRDDIQIDDALQVPAHWQPKQDQQATAISS